MTAHVRGPLTAVAAAVLLVPGGVETAPLARWTPVGVIAAVAVAAALHDGDRARASTPVAIGAGLVTALTWTLDPALWVRTSAWLAVALISAWSVEALSHRAAAMAAAVGALAPAALTGVIFVASADGADVLGRSLGEAWTAGGTRFLVHGAAAAMLTVTLAGIGTNEARWARRARWLCAAAAVIAAATLVHRMAWIASWTTLATDMVVWSEAPFLSNALRLSAALPLYGPPSETASYIYSPGLDLAHRALLGPLGLELSLPAHRSLGLLWQLAAALALVGALRRFAAPGAAPVVAVLLAAFSSLLSPFIHADHAVLLCFACATAVVVAEPALPRWAWVALLVTTPIAATALKLTGAGIGLGLVLAYAVERRPDALRLLGASAVAAIATLPLFDATLGACTEWTLRIPSEHPLVWSSLWSLPSSAAGACATLAAAMLWISRGEANEGSQRAARRVALLTLGATTTSLASFVKFGGRENSLLPLLVGSTVVIVLLARRSAPRAPGLLWVGAAWLGVATADPRPIIAGADREVLDAGHRAMVARIDSDLAAGRHPHPYSGTAAWIDAGRREPLPDRAQSATELWVARSADVGAHLERLADGRYDTLLVAESVLRPRDTPTGALAAELRERLSPVYRFEQLAPGILALEKRAPGRPGDQ